MADPVTAVSRDPGSGVVCTTPTVWYATLRPLGAAGVRRTTAAVRASLHASQERHSTVPCCAEEKKIMPKADEVLPRKDTAGAHRKSWLGSHATRPFQRKCPPCGASESRTEVVNRKPAAQRKRGEGVHRRRALAARPPQHSSLHERVYVCCFGQEAAHQHFGVVRCAEVLEGVQKIRKCVRGVQKVRTNDEVWLISNSRQQISIETPAQPADAHTLLQLIDSDICFKKWNDAQRAICKSNRCASSSSSKTPDASSTAQFQYLHIRELLSVLCAEQLS